MSTRLQDCSAIPRTSGRKKVRFFRGKSPPPPERAKSPQHVLDNDALLRKLSALDEAEEEVKRARLKVLEAAVCGPAKFSTRRGGAGGSPAALRYGGRDSDMLDGDEDDSFGHYDRRYDHHGLDDDADEQDLHGNSSSSSSSPGEIDHRFARIPRDSAVLAKKMGSKNFYPASRSQGVAPAGGISNKASLAGGRTRSPPPQPAIKKPALKSSLKKTSDLNVVPTLDLQDTASGPKFFDIADSPRTRAMRESEDPIGNWFETGTPVSNHPPASTKAMSTGGALGVPVNSTTTKSTTTSTRPTGTCPTIAAAVKNKQQGVGAQRRFLSPPPKPTVAEPSSDEEQDSDASSQCTEVSMHVLECMSEDEDEPCGEPGCRSGRTSSAASTLSLGSLYNCDSSVGSLYNCETPKSMGSIYGSNAGSPLLEEDDSCSNEDAMNKDGKSVLNLENLAAHNAALNAIRCPSIRDKAFLPKAMKIRLEEMETKVIQENLQQPMSARRRNSGGDGNAAENVDLIAEQSNKTRALEAGTQDQGDVVEEEKPILPEPAVAHKTEILPEDKNTRADIEVGVEPATSIAPVQVADEEVAATSCLADSRKEKQSISASSSKQSSAVSGVEETSSSISGSVHGAGNSRSRSRSGSDAESRHLPVMLRKLVGEQRSCESAGGPFLSTNDVWVAPDVTLVNAGQRSPSLLQHSNGDEVEVARPIMEKTMPQVEQLHSTSSTACPASSTSFSSSIAATYSMETTTSVVELPLKPNATDGDMIVIDDGQEAHHNAATTSSSTSSPSTTSKVDDNVVTVPLSLAAGRSVLPSPTTPEEEEDRSGRSIHPPSASGSGRRSVVDWSDLLVASASPTEQESGPSRASPSRCKNTQIQEEVGDAATNQTRVEQVDECTDEYVQCESDKKCVVVEEPGHHEDAEESSFPQSGVSSTATKTAHAKADVDLGGSEMEPVPVPVVDQKNDAENRGSSIFGSFFS
ncbi:unnamed protein product [Amoebophrya sp. A25]|nr:unnamed protein product [Amoebophrya sp. A25]|eukprot:GSA25T00007867001.1